MPEPRITQYVHHHTLVFVQEELQGKHREHCLCWHCDRLKPGQPDNCPIAQQLYRICVDNSLVTPVYECPKFLHKGLGSSAPKLDDAPPAGYRKLPSGVRCRCAKMRMVGDDCYCCKG